MDKNILIQYVDMQQEIADLEERIDKIQQQSAIAHDTVQNGYKRNLVIVGIDLTRLHKLDMYKAKLKVFYDKLLDLQNKSEEVIQEVKDSKMRQILRLRCMDGLSWIKIGFKTGLGEEASKKRFQRFFDK